MTWMAPIKVVNTVSLRHSSLSRPLKDSMRPFWVGFPGRAVVPFDAVLLLPVQHRIQGQFAAIVVDDHRRIAAPECGNAIEFADDAPA